MKAATKVAKQQDNHVVEFFRSNNPLFVAACNKVGIPPTRRQASKWLSGRGLAYKEGRS